MSDGQQPSGEFEARVMKLAARALDEAMREEWDAARATVRELDGPGLLLAVTAWCDTLFAKQRRAAGLPGELGPSEVACPAWVDGATGGLVADADVSPAARWAGQLIAARAAGDHGTYRALLGAIPPQEAGIYVGGLLETVALSMNRLRGGAR